MHLHQKVCPASQKTEMATAMTAHRRSLSSPEMAVLALRHEGAGMRPVASERSLEHLASLRRGDREEEELLQVSQRRSNPAPPWGHPWCQPPMPTGGRAHLASTDSYRPNSRPQSVLTRRIVGKGRRRVIDLSGWKPFCLWGSI